MDPERLQGWCPEPVLTVCLSDKKLLLIWRVLFSSLKPTGLMMCFNQLICLAVLAIAGEGAVGKGLKSCLVLLSMGRL